MHRRIAFLIALSLSLAAIAAERLVLTQAEVLERSMVDRVPDAPAFVQMFPSSEVTPSRSSFLVRRRIPIRPSCSTRNAPTSSISSRRRTRMRR